MPLPEQKASEGFIQVDRIFVDSADRTAGTVSDYRIDLDELYEDVIGIELTGFAIPSSLTPTFRGSYNDKFDFELSTAAQTRQFTVTMPNFSYTYQNVQVPYLSLVNALQQKMQTAIATDSVFGTNGTNPVLIFVLADPEQRTHILVSGTGLTQFRLLFATGPNNNLLAYQVLGFDKQDYSTASEIISPRRTLLEPFRSIEIYIDEFPELQPLAVIYNTNAAYYGEWQNETNLTRLRLLSSSPPLRIDRLTLRIRTGGVPVEDLLKNEHSLSFTIFHIAYEDKLPSWLNQMLAM